MRGALTMRAAFAAALLAVVLLLVLPAAGATAPRQERGDHGKSRGGGEDGKPKKPGRKKGPGGAAACATGTYDTGGSPGSGPVDDPLFSRQWGLDQINAPEAWARGARGAGATVAVLDTGVDLAHPDLRPNLVAGEDLVGGGCAGPHDEHGHGTHVAGIAAAAAGNSIGVAGVAPDAKVMPVRVLDEDGSGAIDDIADGIRLAADRGADVINLSLGELPVIGQLEPLNTDLEDAAEHAWQRGAVIVAAAGNETFPLCSYPAAARRAICVAATDRRGLPTYYSNFPVDPDLTVAVRAPGGVGSPFCEDDEDVWSTILPGSSLDCDGVSGYDTLAGTSMAAPHVAGVASLLAGLGLSNEEILARIRTTSSNGGTYEPVFGYGVVDADAATAP